MNGKKKNPADNGTDKKAEKKTTTTKKKEEKKVVFLPTIQKAYKSQDIDGPTVLKGSYYLESMMGSAVAATVRAVLGSICDEAESLMLATRAERSEERGEKGQSIYRNMDRKRRALSAFYQKNDDSAVRRGAVLAVILSMYDIHADLTAKRTKLWRFVRDMNGKVRLDKNKNATVETVDINKILPRLMEKNYKLGSREIQCLNTVSKLMSAPPAGFLASMEASPVGTEDGSDTISAFRSTIRFLSERINTDTTAKVLSYLTDNGIEQTWTALRDTKKYENMIARQRNKDGKKNGNGTNKGGGGKEKKSVQILDSKGNVKTLHLDKVSSAATKGDEQTREQRIAEEIEAGLSESDAEAAYVEAVAKGQTMDGWAAIRSALKDVMGPTDSETCDVLGATIFSQWLESRIERAESASESRDAVSGAVDTAKDMREETRA